MALNCVIFGPPGSGKGTQAEGVCRKYGLEHLSTGDVLREAIRRKTPLGLKADELISEGHLVPDDVVDGIVRNRIVPLIEAGKGILLDGFPRTVEQAHFLDDILEEMNARLDVVAVLEIESQELVKRICGRRLCSKDTEHGPYNVNFMPPKVPGICDDCGSDLFQRPDDNEQALEERMEIYRQQTLPILEHYREKEVLIKVAGSGTVSEVRDCLLSEISSKTGS